MTLLDRNEFNQILERQDEPCVSIFMPTHRVGVDTQQDPIRLKNLLNQAETRLTETGLRSPEARALLEPVQTLFADTPFWQRQGDGLALFIASDLFKTYPLPFKVNELVVVANRFHVKPMLPLLNHDEQFYILALSKNQLKLFQGTRYTIRELDLPEDTPTSLAEAIKYDVPERQQQFHTKTSPDASGRAAVFHGQGSGVDDERTNLLRYFRKVDKSVSKLLQNQQAPLVLAGVKYHFPVYQEANTYPHLIDEGVEGNPEPVHPHDLHEQAWKLVHPYFRQTRHEATQQYKRLSNTDQALKDLRRIIPAAHYGQVDTLFVALGHRQWGKFDPDTQTVQLHAQAEIGDEDLLNFAAVRTLLHGGTVYAVEPEKVPDNAPMAAVFRYS